MSTNNGAVIFDALNDIANDGNFLERFEDQRRNIGKGHNQRNAINSLVKKAFASLKRGDGETIERCRVDIAAKWEELKAFDLPADIGWGFDSEAGQEIIEFYTVIWVYPKIFGGPEIEQSIPDPKHFRMNPQTWISGIADSVGELKKTVRQYLLRKSFSMDERISIRERFLEVAYQLYSFLEQFEDVYGQVINNSRRRGYGNTFRGALGRVERFIEQVEEDVVKMLDESAVHTSHGLKKEEVRDDG